MSGDARCTAALLAAGAAVCLLDEDELTPVMIALWFGNFACAELLLSRGAGDVFSFGPVRLGPPMRFSFTPTPPAEYQHSVGVPRCVLPIVCATDGPRRAACRGE